MEIEVATPKLNDTGRREVNTEENNSQINHSTEAHNETVKKELFETPMEGEYKRINKYQNKQQKQKDKYTCA